ncbi:MAG: ABC transporter ATP-binding protein [Planctomycetes bacterium]|nr:ABC transporter ATP-binding protein [Planctomycetota bacterium]
MSDPAAIECEDVVRVYEGGLVEALRGVSFSIPARSSAAIVGPSGSGKSTLLHLIGALDRPTSGRVSILGEDLEKIRDLDTLRGRTIGFVFQLHHLIPNLPLWENVTLPALPLGIPRAERKRKACDLLERVGLAARVNFLPVKCSGGERQRAAVARALINDPKILLADEPTGSVDSETGRQILELFETFAKERDMTRVIITHNEAIAAQADMTLRIVDGRLAEPKAVEA